MTEHKTLAAALIASQRAFGDITKDKTVRGAKYSYNYADLGSVLDAVTDALHDNGLVVAQPLDVIDGRPVVRTTLLHTSGERIEGNALVVYTNTTDPQAYGGGITYTRRYALMAMLNLSTEDDDGNRARAPRRSEPEPERGSSPVQHVPDSATTSPPINPDQFLQSWKIAFGTKSKEAIADSFTIAGTNLDLWQLMYESMPDRKTLTWLIDEMSKRGIEQSDTFRKGVESHRSSLTA